MTGEHPLCKEALQVEKHEEPEYEGVSGLLLVAVGVGLGYHLVADDIEHGTTGEGEHAWEEYLAHDAEGIACPYTEDFKKADGEGDGDGAQTADTGEEQGGDDDHSLGHILQGDAEGDGQRRAAILDVGEAYAGGNALGELVEGDGHDEEEDAGETLVVAVLLGVEAGEHVEMRRDEVEDVEEECPDRGATHYEPPLTGGSHLGGGEDEAGDGRGEHDTGTEAEDGVVPAMGEGFDTETEDAANECGAAETGGR